MKKITQSHIRSLLVTCTMLAWILFIWQAYKAADTVENGDTYNNGQISFTIQQAQWICDNVNEIPVSECQALIELYQATLWEERTNNHRRLSNNLPCSRRWISCTDNHVVAVSLSNNNLQGILPNDLWALTHLRALYLSKNNLSWSIPVSLLELAHIQHLELSKNNLTGPIPASIWSLWAAMDSVAVFLDDNLFCDKLPSAIATNNNLTHLVVAYNNLMLNEENYTQQERDYITMLLNQQQITTQNPQSCS